MRKNTSIHNKLKSIYNFCITYNSEGESPLPLHSNLLKYEEKISFLKPVIYIVSNDEIIGMINYISYTENYELTNIYNIGNGSKPIFAVPKIGNVSGNCSLARFDTNALADIFEQKTFKQKKPFDIIIIFSIGNELKSSIPESLKVEEIKDVWIVDKIATFTAENCFVIKGMEWEADYISCSNAKDLI